MFKYKKYKYNFIKIIITILLLPIIIIKSNKVFSKYKKFCYTYPRFGKYHSKNGEYKHLETETNCLEYYYWDLKKMNIKQNSFFKKNLVEFSIDTSKGPISCLQAKNKNSKKWVIGLHGWTEDKYLALRLTSHFYDNGYNILTFDSFAHGKTYGENTDIGFSSIEIINSIINFLKKENDISVIGLIGNSMGASTSILYSQVGKYNVNWVIADCGFSDIKTQYRYYVQNNFLKKSWLFNTFRFTSKFSKLTKTKQSKYNLLKKMKENKNIPIFFIHAKGDTFIPFEMSLTMFNKKIKFENNALSQFWNPTGSEHVYVLSDYNDQYISKTLFFAKESEKNKNETK